MIRFSLAQLNMRAKGKPQGFWSDVLASSRASGAMYEIDPAIYADILARYVGPTKWDMTKSAARAALDAVASGFEVRPLGEIDRVLAICDRCEYLRREQGACGLCGCKLRAKVLFKAWDCPANRWRQADPVG